MIKMEGGIQNTMSIAYELYSGKPSVISGLLLAVALSAVTLSISMFSIFAKGQNDDTRVKWAPDVFTVRTVSLAVSPIAIWVITEDGRLMSKVDTSVSGKNAISVLQVFDRQAEQRNTRGIFIYSWSYAIPDIPEEHQVMSEYLYERYHNSEWRKSENALIEELREECNKRMIPLYVNLSSKLSGKWKKLSPQS
jgi:hypothetical protein